MTTTPKELGNIFKRARENLNLSINEVCDKTRMHPTVVKDIENGVFDRLGKLYIKGFLKKYSTLLKLDYENILKKYESVDAISPAPEFEFTLKPGKRGHKLRSALVPSRKKLQVALISVLSVVLIALVMVFVSMVRSRLSATPQEQLVPAGAKVSSTAARFFQPAGTLAPVTLTLEADKEVWTQVSSGRKTLFSGVLEKGASKTWTSKEPLTVWAGRAENLSFLVNDRRISGLPTGVVKNIVVSSSGVKVGSRWTAQFD